MFCFLEEKIQSLTVAHRRILLLGGIICPILLGFYADFYSINKIFDRFEYVIFMGNILFSTSLLSFFTFRRKLSKRPFTKLHYFSQMFIILLVIINSIILSSENISDNNKSSVVLITNIFIWHAISLNISLIYLINKNNEMEYKVRNKNNPIIYFTFISLLSIPVSLLINSHHLVSICIIQLTPIILLITSLENTPQKSDKNELIVLTLFAAIFCSSYNLGLCLNYNPIKNNFLNELAIFLTLGVLSYRNHLKLSTEFNKIHNISITLARKMGELSLMHIEAQRSEVAKENFLATMSHEIRTPVNGIIGHAELLIDTNINEEQKRLLSMITISSNNLMKLINEVLDLPNLISGKIILSNEKIEVSELVESVIDVVSPKSFEKGLDLTYFIEPSVPQEILGDHKRIGQILLNLCNNALKFTEKGEVFIGVTQIDQSDENHVELLFEVKDTGVGIPANKIKKLFKAYSQTDASISRKFGGTGLGLAISAQLIELMKGRIWVESFVGKGTRFLFTLKCEKPKQFSEPKYNVANLAGLKILIISENPTMRYILGRRFKQWKMIAKIVSKFEEAQNIIGIEEFRVLIVDIVSENKKAVMFLKANQINPTGKIPSIALISLGKNATPDLQHIANETITKPLKTEMLAKTITTIIINKELPKNIQPTIQKQSEIPSVNSFNKNIPSEKIKNIKILVAEDNPVNQKLIMSVLAKMGFKPKLVENGRLAVEEEEKEKYDLILMDLQMPEMDGISATKNIILNSRTRSRPKIIAVTANAMSGDKERCLDAGMDDYISKPIQFQVLADKMMQWIKLETKSESESKPQLDETKSPLIEKSVSNSATTEGVKTMNTEPVIEKQTQTIKILVAEDNLVNQKLIISILKKLGYSATLVENGALAYEAAAKENFDIIIMDLQMPVMDGLEATRKIKSSDGINPKPIIIALTANAMAGDKERCLDAGMDDYMTKPIQIKVLEENLKKWGNLKSN